MATPERRIRPPRPLVEALKASRRVVLVTHVNPDGDGLGSEAALATALRALGKDVVVANHDATPATYSFLGLEAHGGPAADCDLAVALDCPVPERLGTRGRAAFEGSALRVVMDHHLAKESFGDLVWIEDRACATGEMIEALLPELGVAATPPMATAMYAAIVNDTGCFRHDNADAFAFAAAVRLLEAGADARGVTRRLMDEKPLRQVRLQARALSDLRILAGGKGALVAVSLDDLKAFGATWEDTDGLSEALRSIEGVEVGAMLRQEGPDTLKLSLRSKFGFDVNALAGRWGGGGHAKAAGATLRMPFGQAVAEVAAALETGLGGSSKP